MKQIFIASSLFILLLAGCEAQESLNEVKEKDSTITEAKEEEIKYFRLRYDRPN